MGAFCCCQRQEYFDYAPQSNGSCCQQCCARCCCNCCLRCCSCLCPVFFRPSEEHDASSVHSASPSQSAGLLGGISTGVSIPDTYYAPPMPSSYDSEIRCSRPQVDRLRLEKNGTNSVHMGDTAMLRAKISDYSEGKSDVDDPKGKWQQSKIVGKAELITSLMDDEDICPTCLEGYDEENPKIITKCGHHFHLGCILEWMERSSNCPLCDKEMVFTESP